MLSMFARPEDKGRSTAPKAAAPGAAGPAPSRATIRLMEPPPANANRNPPRTSQLVEGKTHSVGQYLHHLQHDIKSYVRAETVNAVMDTTPAEIQRVARILAKLKGRYLAQLIDLGNGAKGPIGEPEIRELRRHREMFEEVELGLNALRDAIEAGDLELDGVRAD
jgi:hypothetical protein